VRVLVTSIDPLPSIEAAIEQGRTRRDRTGHWSRLRAVVLTLLADGWSRPAVGELLGFSASRVGNLRAEACDAVLRSTVSSAQAEAACAQMWRSWCYRFGDAEACARL
jgi:hypothetical protein